VDAGRLAPVTGLSIGALEATRGAFRLGPIDLDAPDGEATVLLGPSGAGKTTLLRAIAGFVPVSKGTVRLGGASVDEEPPHRRGIGFVPPDLGLFPHRRVGRNVSYPLELRGAPDAGSRAAAWIERFGLSGLADRYPSQLSSGERQRVALARALAAEPRLLLWDEPLSALDVESRDVLVGILREVLEERHLPLLLVTHDPPTAFALASRLVVLEEGRVRFRGSPHELVHDPFDRFVARFAGYENLYSADELAAAAGSSVAPSLRGAAGPDGLALPVEAVGWSAAGPAGAAARVASLRWGPGGWTVGIRDGPLLLFSAPTREPPPVRVGDPVDLRVDASAGRPLGRRPR
jgi:ABC-type Fe3+/spermidine/putrescine transport system ATPase subunit